MILPQSSYFSKDNITIFTKRSMIVDHGHELWLVFHYQKLSTRTNFVTSNSLEAANILEIIFVYQTSPLMTLLIKGWNKLNWDFVYGRTCFGMKISREKLNYQGVRENLSGIWKVKKLDFFFKSHVISGKRLN